MADSFQTFARRLSQHLSPLPEDEAGLLALLEFALGPKPLLAKLTERLLAKLKPKVRIPSTRSIERVLLADQPLRSAVAKGLDLIDLAIEAHQPRAELRWPTRPLDTVGDVANWLQLSPEHLLWFADARCAEGRPRAEALLHYRRQWLRKRSGAWRLIESPKDRLKAIQRLILRDILDHVPPHSAVHGFCKGRSCMTLAQQHCRQDIVLRMDLADFFPSVPRARVQRLFMTLGYREPVATVLSHLCTTVMPVSALAARDTAEHRQLLNLYGKPHLPQGAPTSPALANLCALRMDRRLAGLAKATGATYGRYADDLVFSGGNDLARSADAFLTRAAAIAMEEGFQVNFRKTRLMRSGVRQHAVGLTLNAQPNISRRDYDTLKATLHNCVKHGPVSQNHQEHPHFREQLRGRVAHVMQVNPDRGAKLLALWNRVAW
jgi:RNA-directed DNA polymerase